MACCPYGPYGRIGRRICRLDGSISIHHRWKVSSSTHPPRAYSFRLKFYISVSLSRSIPSWPTRKVRSWWRKASRNRRALSPQPNPPPSTRTPVKSSGGIFYYRPKKPGGGVRTREISTTDALATFTSCACNVHLQLRPQRAPSSRSREWRSL